MVALGALALPMLSIQTQLLFPTDNVPEPGPVPKSARPLQVEAADGVRLHGLHIPASDGGEARTLVLGFGGNAWNGADVASYLHQLYPDAEVIAFHYRGYRPSSGKPSADALIADAPLLLDAAQKAVEAERTLLVGFSIGSGVAASLAARGSVDGLILVTPFDSLKAVARDMYPWLPIGPFLQHEIDAGRAVGSVKAPTAIVAAERDEIIPAARTDALRRMAKRLVFDRTIAGAGHNDLYARSDFHGAMREARTVVEKLQEKD